MFVFVFVCVFVCYGFVSGVYEEEYTVNQSVSSFPERIYSSSGVTAFSLSTQEYKGRTKSNSPTGPNEAVCVATLLL